MAPPPLAAPRPCGGAPGTLLGRRQASAPPQQYAGRHVRTGGAVSSRAAVTALQDGGATPARQVRLHPDTPTGPGSPEGWV